jgi:hypothetical protein
MWGIPKINSWMKAKHPKIKVSGEYDTPLTNVFGVGSPLRKLNPFHLSLERQSGLTSNMGLHLNPTSI